MSDFNIWKSFEYQQATVQLWVFKKSTTDAKFRAWHVRTDVGIEDLFRNAIMRDAAGTTELISYSPVSQNNESSCLSHSLDQSEGLIALLELVDRPELENVDARLEHLKGAAGYLVKFCREGKDVYAIRRTAPNWKPQVRNSFINAIFHNGELSATPEETFSFDSSFDFYSVNETILIKSKRAYESAMAEKKVYEKNFQDLVVEPGFAAIFSDVAPLRDFVGNNAMHLRRITVIQSKALYLRPDFSQRIQHVNALRGFGLSFDGNGKLVVSSETAKTIMQILLDHRLYSEITETTYDVPDAEAI